MMDQHPDDWWEIATDATAFRVTEETARAVAEAMRDDGFTRDAFTRLPRAETFTDIYGAEFTIVVGQLLYVYHITPAVRHGTRFRDELGKREDEAFAREHEKPEWESA